MMTPNDESSSPPSQSDSERFPSPPLPPPPWYQSHSTPPPPPHVTGPIRPDLSTSQAFPLFSRFPGKADQRLVPGTGQSQYYDEGMASEPSRAERGDVAPRSDLPWGDDPGGSNLKWGDSEDEHRDRDDHIFPATMDRVRCTHECAYPSGQNSSPSLLPCFSPGVVHTYIYTCPTCHSSVYLISDGLFLYIPHPTLLLTSSQLSDGWCDDGGPGAGNKRTNRPPLTTPSHPPPVPPLLPPPSSQSPPNPLLYPPSCTPPHVPPLLTPLF